MRINQHIYKLVQTINDIKLTLQNRTSHYKNQRKEMKNRTSV